MTLVAAVAVLAVPLVPSTANANPCDNPTFAIEACYTVVEIAENPMSWICKNVPPLCL